MAGQGIEVFGFKSLKDFILLHHNFPLGAEMELEVVWVSDYLKWTGIRRTRE